MVRIIVNVAAYVLAIYLSIHKPITTRLKAIIWTIAILITVGNIYVWLHEQRQQKPFVDALIPSMSDKEAFGFVKDSFAEELRGYDLVDVIGSSYICLNKPDVIFHRFPEWTLIFRKDQDHLLEFKVSDSRIPDPVPMDSNALSEANDGQIAYYIVCKKGFYDFSGNKRLDSAINYAIDIIDHYGRAIIILHGRGPEDNISETEDGLNSKVLARVQIIGRPTDHVSEYRAIEDVSNKRTIYVRKAKTPISSFYASLLPIRNWNIGAEKAVEIAMKQGGTGTPPGKEQVGGHPTVRLFDGTIYNLQGIYWRIPYRISIRPLLVDASSGALYAVNNAGNYSTKWEASFPNIPAQEASNAPFDNIKAAPAGEEEGAKAHPEYSYREPKDHQFGSENHRFKDVTELNGDELDAANAICRKALQEHFGGQIAAWYETTYHLLPTSDDGYDRNLSNMRKLDRPITVISAAGMIVQDMTTTKQQLKEIVCSYGASLGDRKLHIVEAMVIVEPAGGGGSIGMSYDKVTVIPYRVSVE